MKTSQVAAPYDLMNRLRMLALKKSTSEQKVTIKQLVSEALMEYLEKHNG